MSASAAAPAPTAMTGCLAPIDKGGLDDLIAKGRANPAAVKTLTCTTIAEGRFRHLNMIRDLPPYIVDEPPGLLGDDPAPGDAGLYRHHLAAHTPRPGIGAAIEAMAAVGETCTSTAFCTGCRPSPSRRRPLRRHSRTR